MIQRVQGNLLDAQADILVNTVNCYGVMGKGIALQFKYAYKDNFRLYAEACRVGEIEPGRVFITAVPPSRTPSEGENAHRPKYIANFPTKVHWKERSRLEYVRSGLLNLVEQLRLLDVQSVAVPPLGCGNGGLEWRQVAPLIEEAFAQLPQLHVWLYEPKGSPAADAMPVDSCRPELTRARALMIGLMERYLIEGFEINGVVAQKLAYFLQETGEKMNLRYVPHKYGPYANNLHHLLQVLEGHYLKGSGDRTQRSEIHLKPQAAQAAMDFLQGDSEAQFHLRRVADLIEGYEHPYALELMSTVHWVAKHDASAARDPSAAVQAVHKWSEYKRRKFVEGHIRDIWHHLASKSWITTALPETAPAGSDVTP